MTAVGPPVWPMRQFPTSSAMVICGLKRGVKNERERSKKARPRALANQISPGRENLAGRKIFRDWSLPAKARREPPTNATGPRQCEKYFRPNAQAQSGLAGRR